MHVTFLFSTAPTVDSWLNFMTLWNLICILEMGSVFVWECVFGLGCLDYSDCSSHSLYPHVNKSAPFVVGKW